MAITYLSGERIQGSSTADATPTYTPSMASTSGWSIQDSAKVNITGGKIAGTSGTGSAFADFTRDNSNDGISFDLGSAVSDSQWTMRFKLTIDTVTLNSSSGCATVIGLWDHNSADGYATTGDNISLSLLFSSSSSEQNLEGNYTADGAGRQNVSEIGSDLIIAGKTYYVTINRKTVTTCSVSVTENSDYETGLTTVNITPTSGVTGLQYFGVYNYVASSVDNHVYASVEDVKIWNEKDVDGLTQDDKTTITNVPAGTRYEEVDTRKIFQARYDGADTTISWYEKGTSGGGMTQFSYTRGCMGGGGRWSPSSSSSNIIDYITIASTGNAADFGDLTSSRGGCAGINSTTRGCFAGGMEIAGSTFTNIIDYITILTAGNATDFGDLNDSQWLSGGCSDLSRGLSGGGRNAGYENVIDYFTISTTGNATDFGDLTQGRGGIGAVADSTRGVFAGGYGPSDTNVIDYVTIQTTGNAVDFGDLTVARAGASGAASATRGVFAGGAAHTGDTIDYITIQTTGNATDFGNQTESRIWTASCSNLTRGTWAGGEQSANTHSEIIDYVTIDTTGNATDFGDLTDSGRIYPSGVSG